VPARSSIHGLQNTISDMVSSTPMKIRKSNAVRLKYASLLFFFARYARDLNRRKPIFDSALKAFTETILPNQQNAKLIRSARDELASSRTGIQTQPDLTSPSYVGVHIRRGDRKAVSWEFHGNYVPIPNFIGAIKTTWSRLFSSKNIPRPCIYLASDSPTAQESVVQELQPNFSIFSLAQSKDPALRALTSREEYVQKSFNDLNGKQRIIATRGMIVDFALVSGMWAQKGDVSPAATICTIRLVRFTGCLLVRLKFNETLLCLQFECMQDGRCGAGMGESIWPGRSNGVH
jgi:hypothetical protein